MPLIDCPDCKKEMSKAAPVCPHCGRPNKQAKRAEQANKQGIGCLVALMGLGLVGFIEPVTGVVFIGTGIILFLAAAV